MGDAELAFEHPLDGLLDVFEAIPGFLLYHHMGVESGNMLLHLPKMGMMDVRDTVDSA